MFQFYFWCPHFWLSLCFRSPKGKRIFFFSKSGDNSISYYAWNFNSWLYAYRHFLWRRSQCVHRLPTYIIDNWLTVMRISFILPINCTLTRIERSIRSCRLRFVSIFTVNAFTLNFTLVFIPLERTTKRIKE